MHSNSSILKYSTRRHQAGMTLISLMVSIVIMLVGVLISLRIHNSNEATVETIRNATTHNRLLVTALNVAQKEIQSAGYGMAGANEDDVIVQITPRTAVAPASTSILWRFIDGGTVHCRGIKESNTTFDGSDFRSLSLISSATDCNDTAALTSFSWDGIEGILGRWKIVDELTAYIDSNETLFDFQIDTDNCAGLRSMNQSAHVVVSIFAPNMAALYGHDLPSNNVDLCLVNVVPG